MAYSTPPSIGPFPPSSVVTGSRSTSVSNLNILDISAGRYIPYVGSYFEIKNRGGRIVRYTGKYPYAPKNEDSSNPKVSSNIQILTTGELGTSINGKLEPKLYVFTHGLIAEDWRVERAPRFFARNLITGEYRETDYNSYIGIYKKDSSYNFKDWEVKVLYFGWRINGTISNVYSTNKQKIYCLDQGTPIPDEPGVTSIPPSLVSSTDPNPRTPWPGFKEWFTEGKWAEEYLVAYDNTSGKKGRTQSNPWYKTSTSPVTPPKSSSGPAIFELKTQNDPSIPPTCRWYLYDSDPNFGTPNASPKPGKEDETYFLQAYAPVLQDVLLDGSFSISVLSTTKDPLSAGIFFKTISSQSPFAHYLSEIFLPLGKSSDGKTPYNPNSPLVKKRPNLYYSPNSPYPNQPYTTGPFCKNIDGDYYTGNIIARGVGIENYPLYNVLDTPGIDNTLIENETKEAFVFDSTSKSFSSPPYNSTTEIYSGQYTQPVFTSEEGLQKTYTAPFYPFPKTESSPRIRKIYYRYVYKENGFFFADQFSTIDPLIKSQNRDELINLAYEGWIHWFDTQTNGINQFTALTIYPPNVGELPNVGKRFPYNEAFLERNFLNSITNNIWGIRTGQYPQQNSQKLFRAEVTYYSY